MSEVLVPDIGDFADVPVIEVLVTAGEQDPVGNYGAGVRTVYEWIKGAGVQDATLKLYPNDRHEIHNELDRAQVYADLADWMDARIGGKKTDQ